MLANLFLLSAALTSVIASPVQHEPRQTASASLSAFLTTESPIALQGVLNNIGADGADAPGAKAGIVVASPDSTNPDCKSLNLHGRP